MSSNLVSYREREANQIPASTNFLKLGSSLCYHTISVRTFFCVCIFLMFRFAYLAYYCFCAMLFLVSHLSIVTSLAACVICLVST